ncbi:putative CDP-glycerol:poly (Glycerophosphate) glycerophosphotransferase [Lactiplantibacillus plantarum]|uniref:CDP-glycerol glycerophosphotransferase family protein n=1 Tax=Lactiplantibacillus plantarum TaxID=1590 RepID=UPI003854BA91|nr:putative CDP-glycerol:poly (Glycerophosphate) glycerophosphotransferase [Lactiplantibacillus plantarum]
MSIFRRFVMRMLKETKLFSFLYIVYSRCLIAVLKLLFFRKTSKTVLFVSYGGKQISDSPKRIFDLMNNDPFFKDYDLIWGVLDTKKFSSQGFNVVKMDSLKYFVTCLTSRVWITNSGIKRYTNVKGNHTFFVNTWHGIPMKKIGRDEVNVKKSPLFEKKWEEFADADVNVCCTEYDYRILKHVFNAKAQSMRKIGLPRNDSLYNQSININQLKEKIGIPLDKKVILYAPTVRGNQTDFSGTNDFTVPIHLDLWKKYLPDYVILFRAHYFVTEIVESHSASFIDVTKYPNLNELMQVSDLLITDYSSLIFDYSILTKPIFCYAYDFSDYKKYQGIYEEDINEKVPNFVTKERQLIEQIGHLNLISEQNKTKKFCERYIGNHSGNSGKNLVSIIKDDLR